MSARRAPRSRRRRGRQLADLALILVAFVAVAFPDTTGVAIAKACSALIPLGDRIAHGITDRIFDDLVLPGSANPTSTGTRPESLSP